MKRMKERYGFISLIIIFFIVFEIIISSICCATDSMQIEKQKHIIIVDKNGKGNYISIQEAIDKAQEETTILIKAGEYNEILNINKKIKLIGENKENTIIHSKSEQNKYSIRLNAQEIVIEKLTIKNSGSGLYATGIKVTASKINIQDCLIYETPIGIAIFTSDNIISNCEFYGCTDEAIALLGTSYSECKNNKIINCKFYNNCDGIELQYSTDNIIIECEFYNNTHSGIDAIISSNDRNTILNCNIYNNNVHGVFLSSSSNNQIINCNILDNNNGNIVLNKDSINNEIIKSNKVKVDKKYTYVLSAICFLLNKKFNRPLTKIILELKDKIVF